MLPKLEIDDETKSLVERLAAEYEGGAETLVPILQDINAELNWLPPGVLVRLSELKKVPLERVLRIATFYKAFSLEPRGRSIIRVCTGTACHVKGAPRIIGRFQNQLGVGVGETTADMEFTLEEVRCLGCCGLSPVVTVGEEVHGKLTPATAVALVNRRAA
ncbi:MAG: NAD(P)H-dependent oxidoreductase subunit E [bacterium]|nr:NAD(P)H-dependent oxidoreductase subunit E [bacterium]